MVAALAVLRPGGYTKARKRGRESKVDQSSSASVYQDIVESITLLVILRSVGFVNKRCFFFLCWITNFLKVT